MALCGNSQIPLDLVVKFPRVDFVDVILWRVLRLPVVYQREIKAELPSLLETISLPLNRVECGFFYLAHLLNAGFSFFLFLSSGLGSE